MIRELPGYQVKDGRRCIYLSTCGENPEEISEDMAEFLGYVSANLKESVKESKNSFVKQLQEAVKRIKKSREMGSRYMIFQEMMQEEFEAGKAEGLKQGLERGRIEKIESILELLRKHGTVDQELEESIGKYTDFDVLRKLFTLAVNVDSIEEFVLQMKEI